MHKNPVKIVKKILSTKSHFGPKQFRDQHLRSPLRPGRGDRWPRRGPGDGDHGEAEGHGAPGEDAQRLRGDPEGGELGNKFR